MMGWKSTVALFAFSFFGLGSLVYLLLNRDEDNQDYNLFKSAGSTVLEVKVPKESIGIVIGRGGQTIKEIESKSDTRINIKPDNSTTDYKICMIRGTLEAAQYAESLIHEVIVSQPLIETYEMYVPVQACGRIIGKNSDNIRLICRNSNAKIIIENVSGSSSSTEMKILIRGTTEQIALAKILVEQKVEEELEFRNKIKNQSSSRSPRNKVKYLLPAKNEPEEVNTSKHKERFFATSSNGLLEVYVSAIESPDRLWLQMMGPCTVELDRLNDQMTDYYSKDENKKLHILKEVKCGQIVAAPFTYDDKWYRAEVIEINSTDDSNLEDSDITLYYVDYGDSSQCKKHEIYELRTDFLRLRFQAIECILAKIKPRGSVWTEEAIDLLEDLTHVALWKSLMAKIHTYKERPTRAKREGSPIPCVELYDTVGEKTVNVAEELVEKGFAVWEEELLPQNHSKEPEKNNESSSSKAL